MRPVSFHGIFGWLHPGAGGRGVVLCNPHGFEEICIHRKWRALAEQLAAAGMPTLRFDYQGTGDSVGGDEDPARVRTWIDSIHAAVHWLRRETGVSEVVLVGVRLGALLAATAAAESGDIAALGLLAAPASGRAYTRELKALARMGVQLNGELPSRPEWAGDIEATGFVYTAETLAALEQLDLLALERKPAPRVLLLQRPDMPGDARLGACLASLGAEVDVRPFTGFADFMRDSQFAQLPKEAFDALADWLGRGAPPGEGGAPAPAAPARLELEDAVEEPVFVQSDVPVFGIRCEPLSPATQAPGVIFLNTGSNHHIGSNRFAVTLARRLASLGFASLRLDIAGVGDSPARPGRPENLMYAPESCAEVRSALDWFEARGQRSCIIVGICSGAYLGFHTALQDPRVCGLFLGNAQRFLWREGETFDLVIYKNAKAPGFYFRALLRPAQWKRVLKGEVQLSGRLAGIAERLCRRGLSLLQDWRTRLLGAEEPDQVARWFQDLCRRGLDLMILYSADDTGIDEFESRLGRRAAKLKPWANARFETVPGSDHNFATRYARECFTALLEDYLKPHATGAAAAPRLQLQGRGAPHEEHGITAESLA